MQLIPGDELYLTITPESLREIADDLEREGTEYQRTITTDEGILVNINPAQHT